MPIPSSVMMADVAGSTLNSSAANLRTAVNGVASGTLSLNRKRKTNKKRVELRLYLDYHGH